MNKWSWSSSPVQEFKRFLVYYLNLKFNFAKTFYDCHAAKIKPQKTKVEITCNCPSLASWNGTKIAQMFDIILDQRRFQGGSRGVAPPPVKITGVRGIPLCFPTPCFFATPLIDHQGGAGDPPVIFDIINSGFYITYTNYTT